MIKQLKTPLLCYLISGLLLAFVITFGNAIKKHNRSLQEALSKFSRIKTNLTRMEAATTDMNLLLSRIKNYIPPDFKESSSQKKIFIALDSLKYRMKKAKIAILNFEDGGDVISLPINITGKSNSYSDIVNAIGDIMSLKFPFYEINNIILSENKESAGFSYKISGKLHSPKN